MNKSRKEDGIKLCPKCGNQHLSYSPGIDIGLIYATCINCGYHANQNMFPELSKKEAGKIKVIKGKKLAEIQSRNIITNTISRWTGIIVVIFLLAVFLALVLR